MNTDQGNIQTAPDFHHISVTAVQVSKMQTARNPHQNIQGNINIKLDFKQTIELISILAEQAKHFKDGMGPITFTVEGEMT